METAELHAFAAEVASHLRWQCPWDENHDMDGHLDWAATIKPGATEYGVRLHVDRLHRAHVTCTGCIPYRDREGGSVWVNSNPAPFIRVARKRGSAVAAREIKRRLFPPYDKAYREAKRRIDSYNAELDERDRVYEMLSEFGSPSQSRIERRGRMYLHRGGHVTLTSMGTDLVCSCTAEQAYHILAFLREDDVERGE